LVRSFLAAIASSSLLSVVPRISCQCQIMLHKNLLPRHPYDAQCEECLAPTRGNLYGDAFTSIPIYLLLGFSTDCVLQHGTCNSNPHLRQLFQWHNGRKALDH
jgi:hypothetical protein